MAQPTISNKAVAAGQVIFSEGEPGFELYIIRTGKVIVTRRTGSSTKTIAILGPGAIIGEMAVASGERRSGTATATIECLLTVVPKEVIDQKMSEADPILRLLLLTTFERLRVFAARPEDDPMKVPGT
jgi:CRP-like cAMP-binding protein